MAIPSSKPRLGCGASTLARHSCLQDVCRRSLFSSLMQRTRPMQMSPMMRMGSEDDGHR